MSRYVVGETEYQCGGCEFGPNCPGHKMKVLMDCSTDTYIIEVDGKHFDSVYEDTLHAIIRCIEGKNSNSEGRPMK